MIFLDLEDGVHEDTWAEIVLRKQIVIWVWCQIKSFWMLTCFSEVGDHVSESSPGKLESDSDWGGSCVKPRRFGFQYHHSHLCNKRLVGSFHHIWKSLFMFALHQHQGTNSEPWIELNIWGEDIMSGNSLSRHIPGQLRNINSRQNKLNRGKFVFIIVNGFSCVNAYLWIHFIFCIVGIICNDDLATLTG